jgi:hypothetical protein
MNNSLMKKSFTSDREIIGLYQPLRMTKFSFCRQDWPPPCHLSGPINCRIIDWAADRRPPHTTQSFGFAQDKTMRALALAGRTAHNYFYPLIEPIFMRMNKPQPAKPGSAWQIRAYVPVQG